MNDEETGRLRQYALRLLTLRHRSRKEIRERLEQYAKKKNISPSLIPPLIASFEDAQLLDDRVFASWWVEERKTRNPRAARILGMELQRFGIAKDIIEEVTGRGEARERKDEERARELAQKIADRTERYSLGDRRKKIQQKLLSLGYSFTVIRRAVDSLGEKEYNGKTTI